MKSTIILLEHRGELQTITFPLCKISKAIKALQKTFVSEYSILKIKTLILQ